MFSDHEAMEAWSRSGDAGHGVAGMKAAMAYAVELAAARGGAMTAEDLSECWRLVALPPAATGWDNEIVKDLLQHIAAQGAKVAALKQHVTELEKSLENAREERDETMAKQGPSVAMLERMQRLEERARIGSQMANACYNLVQSKVLDPDGVVTLDRLRQQWDAIGH